MGKKSKIDKNKIIQLLLEGKEGKEVAEIVGCSQPYVTQVKQEFEKLRDPVYIEYLDHAKVRNNPTMIKPPVLVAIGVIEFEDEESICLKQMWSKTTGESFAHAIIVKDCIRVRKKLEVIQNE